ncbi:MAG: cytochrome c biogenesis protein CcdA [Chloroflexi bacterium]|nr:cytochrome c biogenesis protein CcdA [Chloroflexota bacterium]
MIAPSLGLAFLAGLASFLSPCVFTLVPAYVGYLSGRSATIGSLEKGSATRGTVSHGLAFVLGFSAVFILLGLLSSALGALLYNFQWLLTRVGGIIVIVFGVHLTGLVRIPFLDFDLRLGNRRQIQRGYISSAMMGVFFSAGWSPCIGPVLGLILTLAVNGGSLVQGGMLLTAYSAGLAIPFLLAATQIGWVTALVRRHGKLSSYVEKAMGLVMIVIGLYLFSGRMATLGNLGFFFSYFDEARVGVMLFKAFLISLLLGLIVGWIGRKRGKPFVDGLFLGTGLSFFMMLILYALGVASLLNV